MNCAIVSLLGLFAIEKLTNRMERVAYDDKWKQQNYTHTQKFVSESSIVNAFTRILFWHV